MKTIELEELDLEQNEFPVCPHCGAEDPRPWELLDVTAWEGDQIEYECMSCGGSVVATVHVHVEVTFTTEI